MIIKSFFNKYHWLNLKIQLSMHLYKYMHSVNNLNLSKTCNYWSKVKPN